MVSVRFPKKLTLWLAVLVLILPTFWFFYDRLVHASALSFICASSAATTSTNSCTGEQTGDLLLVSASVHNNSTAPTTATNFTSINTVTNSGGNSSTRTALNAGWKVAASSTEGSGTWAGATEVMMMVYRGQSSSPIGNNATSGGNNSGTLVTYAADTLSATDGSSWFAGFVVRNTADNHLFTPPTGMTNRITGGNNLGSPYGAGNDINGPTSSNWASTNETGFGVSAKFTSIVIEIKAAPTITVGATGTQASTLTQGTSSAYIGGAFTFVRDVGTSDVTSIKIHNGGTLAANTYLSNVVLLYLQQTSCSTSVPAGTSAFNVTGGTFNASNDSTVTGSLTPGVGTSQVCVYVEFDVSSSAPVGQTIDIQITNPATDTVASSGTTSPSSAVSIAGTTTITSSAPTTDQLLRGGEYFTGGSKQPYYWAN